MNHDLEVSKSIDVHAAPEKVWKALTDPEIIKEYLFGTQTITDWQVGKPVTFQGEYNGQTYKDKGVVKENIPGRKISYTYWSSFSGTEDKPENYSLVTYTVEPVNDNTTKFTWTQKGYANQEGYEHSKSGMDEFLTKIKSVMEQ
jgi:uncharacterized protein YndB with AHSA1/START domain